MSSLILLSISWQHILIILVFIPSYFIPTFIALSRKKSNTLSIFALNLLLGWSLIGWAGALIWALSNKEGNQNSSSNIDQLTQLKALHDQGVITDEEFEIQKNRLLR
uniref:Superinfection immunity protein n=1 Tax=Chryseobacterium endophyticum TaxID=1854762 RepID=A0AAU6WSH3_9FLAO